MRHKGLEQIKTALAGTDMSSLLEILQVHFGHVASSESDEEENVLEEEETSEVAEEVIAKPLEVGNLSTAELVFPFKSSPFVVAGIPEIFYLSVVPRPFPITTFKSPHVLLILPKKQWLAIMPVVII